MSFVRYQLINFIQSLKVIPPTALFFVWIFLLYAYKNVPILSSYGVSAIVMYVTITWVTMSIFTLEEESEKHILFFQVGGKIKYLIGKWFTIIIVLSFYLAIAILFPVITDSFKGNMSIGLYIVAIYSHFIFSLFGILVGTLFSATKLASKKYSWLLAVFVIVISLSAKSIIEIASFSKWILWFVPPVFQVINHMEGGEHLLLHESMLFDVCFVVIYLLIGFVMLVYLFKKKES